MFSTQNLDSLSWLLACWRKLVKIPANNLLVTILKKRIPQKWVSNDIVHIAIHQSKFILGMRRLDSEQKSGRFYLV